MLLTTISGYQIIKMISQPQQLCQRYTAIEAKSKKRNSTSWRMSHTIVGSPVIPKALACQTHCFPSRSSIAVPVDHYLSLTSISVDIHQHPPLSPPPQDGDKWGNISQTRLRIKSHMRTPTFIFFSLHLWHTLFLCPPPLCPLLFLTYVYFLHILSRPYFKFDCFLVEGG